MDAKVFDEETFEEGMSPLEEIIKGIDESSLFVIFLSEHALESDWVQKELSRAKDLLDAEKISRIYPIIIDNVIKHSDTRIPLWMRESLNIQPILQPTIAARKINSRLTELSWKFHPRLKERQEIFVGRNNLINDIEERLDDFSKQAPVVLIASGLPSIGRKALLQHAIRKSNLVRDSYEFPTVSLSSLDGIEDFILKIHDLGIVSVKNLRERLRGKLIEKIALAKEIAAQIADERERVLIEDRGILIQGNGEVVDWFSDVIAAIGECGKLVFCLASQFRPAPSLNRTNPLFFSVHVSELAHQERNGLLLRYSKFQKLEISRDDYAFFSDLLTGYPEQVLFAVDLVREQGVFGAKKLSHTIQQYGSDKAKIVIDGFKTHQETLDFIAFLSRFEFISYDVLFAIVKESEYFPILEKLLASSVCEQIGVSSGYIRINEVVRDYVSRSRFGLPKEFEAAIKDHVRSFLEHYDDDSYDVSDYIFSAQESLRGGGGIPDDLVIPSVFVKTIKRLYDEDRDYSEAILLADRVLLREGYLHKNTVDHIRYIKCQCLARLRKPEFFTEVRKVSDPNKSFLHGFYYRLSGDYVKAEEYLKRVLGNGKRDPKVIGELILVYMQSDEYDLAYDLAKENYNNRPGNPINANNYFACLIMKAKTPENRNVLESIIARLSIDPSDRAQEMHDSAKARLLAYYDEDEVGSMALIEEAIHKFPGVEYPLLTKADLATFFNNKNELQKAVIALEKLTSRNAQTFRTFIRYKAIYLAMDGKVHEAKQLVHKELRGLIETSRRRLNERLDYFAGK